MESSGWVEPHDTDHGGRSQRPVEGIGIGADHTSQLVSSLRTVREVIGHAEFCHGSQKMRDANAWACSTTGMWAGNSRSATRRRRRRRLDTSCTTGLGGARSRFARAAPFWSFDFVHHVAPPVSQRSRRGVGSLDHVGESQIAVPGVT